MRIGHQRTKYRLIDDVQEEAARHLILECWGGTEGSSRSFIVLRPSETTTVFRIGRGHESDVRLPDISVSRFHALIKLAHDGFYVEDHGSKFGTLALIRHGLVLVPNSVTSLQVGRTVATIQVCPNNPEQYTLSHLLVPLHPFLRSLLFWTPKLR